MDTLKAWQKSDGHCHNMMNPKFTTFAVGYGHSLSSTYKHYWTQMFGSSAQGLEKNCYPTAEELTIAATEAEENMLHSDDFDDVKDEPVAPAL